MPRCLTVEDVVISVADEMMTLDWVCRHEWWWTLCRFANEIYEQRSLAISAGDGCPIADARECDRAFQNS